MPRPLTDTLVRAAKPPERGQATITDSTLRNFALRLSQGGSKTFVVMLGHGRRQTIGHYPTISLSEARTAAKRILAERELGKITPTRTAYDDAVADFLKDRESRLRPRTLKNYTDYLKLLPFKRRALADLTAREIIQILNAHSPSQREHLHRVARTFFRWCVQQNLLDRSPIHALPLPTGAARSRVLTPDELGAVYRTARAGTTPFHGIVTLLCLTGQRRGEISRLEWNWIEGDTITIPAHATKNGREHRFPIGPEAQDCFRGLTKMDDSPYVFPASRRRSPDTTVFNGFSKAKADFDRECGVIGWTLHDARRTYATGLQSLGVRLEVTERLLNHVSGSQAGIVGIYQRYDFMPEMREAVLRWEAWLPTS